jgi:hypothetical protein
MRDARFVILKSQSELRRNREVVMSTKFLGRGTEKSGSSEEAGAPKEAVEAFADAAVKWTGRPAPDPNVAVAFALGWHITEASAWATTGKPPQGEVGLSESERWAVLVGQLGAGHERLKILAGDSAGAAGTTIVALRAKALPDVTPDDVEKLATALLQELYVAGSALGKAFRLGRQLRVMCNADSIEQALRKDGSDVTYLLSQLASKLPPNAAHSVMNSLSLWEKEVVGPPTKPTPEQAGERFQRQGGIWYSLLSGDLAAKDLLRLSDYVGTAEDVVGSLRELAVRTLRGRLLLLVVAVLALFGAGIVLLAISSTAGAVTAAITSFVAAFGLTWKGIGQFLGRATAKGEQALWDAQLDWTIAYRCTIRADGTSAADTTRDRRLDDHVRTWKDWQRRWPDLDGAVRLDGNGSEPAESAAIKKGDASTAS